MARKRIQFQALNQVAKSSQLQARKDLSAQYFRHKRHAHDFMALNSMPGLSSDVLP